MSFDMNFKVFLLVILISGCDGNGEGYTKSGIESLTECESELAAFQHFVETNLVEVFAENYKSHNCVATNIINELEVYQQKFSDCLFLDFVEAGNKRNVEITNSPYRLIGTPLLSLTTSLESCNDNPNNPKLVKLLLEDVHDQLTKILDI